MLQRKFLAYHIILLALIVCLVGGSLIGTTPAVLGMISLIVCGFIVAGIVFFLKLFRAHDRLGAAMDRLREENPQIGANSSREIENYASLVDEISRHLRGTRAEASEALARLNRTMETTLSSFPDPIFVLNSRGAVDFRNPAADTMALKLLFSGVHRLPQKIEALVEEVRANGQDYLPSLYKEAVLFNFDNQEHYFLPRIIQLKDNNSITFGIAVILEDITRMRLLDEVKSNLVATVSHELKTPLTGLRMSLYIVLEQMIGKLNEKQHEVLTIARDEADRMLNTLNNLLDLARLEEGKSSLHFSQLKPLELLQKSLDETRQLAVQASIRVNLQCPADLPEVWVDTSRVGHVFNNLISNALKYSPPGSEILLRAEIPQDQRFVRFSIRDQGPGIAREHAFHVFDRFYRVPDSSKSGAGLGLAIAREIVSAHGGQIGVQSEVGKGSEFYVFLLRTDQSKAPA